MSDTPKKNWSTMSSKEHVESIMKVLTRAGTDSKFRTDCLDQTNGQATVENEAGVTFDSGIKVRCLPDQATAEKEIILVLPDMRAPSGGFDYTKYWLCTYVDYEPERQQALEEISRKFAPSAGPIG
jgi:hypothetical protein